MARFYHFFTVLTPLEQALLKSLKTDEHHWQFNRTDKGLICTNKAKGVCFLAVPGFGRIRCKDRSFEFSAAFSERFGRRAFKVHHERETAKRKTEAENTRRQLEKAMGVVK